ncbi:hypothetical protein K435DRAFT_436497 [Dendrothele bispora CBS 962.96]|uniref:Uncharacterized protein n=1 Tax=Dendrothele bispora (strain CBS 962.96) TaxID=1314807 RepID=A0A4S8L3Q7_DENBC|nr:hypothetical protein K435DRAFT_436497 [Dendrothele bispora CBS 962.96]
MTDSVFTESMSLFSLFPITSHLTFQPVTAPPILPSAARTGSNLSGVSAVFPVVPHLPLPL